MTGERTTSRKRRPSLTVASIAAAVLLAGGGTAYWATTAYGGQSAAPAAARTPAPGPTTPPPGIAPGEPDPGGGGVAYRAAVALPQGPGSAPGYRFAAEVTGAEVARLAAALGIDGAPRLSGGMWRAGVFKDPSGPRLQVNREAPGAWTYTRYQAGGGDDCARGKDTCGPVAPQEGGADPGSGAPVGEAAAKAAAQPVLKAAGLSGAKLDASLVAGAVRVVAADPVVGGLPTHNWQTKVQIGQDGQVVGGSGELAAPVRGPVRDVLTAEQALERLNAAAPRPRIGGCATPVPDRAGITDEGAARDIAPDAAQDTSQVPCLPDGTGPAEPTRTEKVTGAVLGLTPGTEGGARQLVPAWLFSVAGQDGGPGHVVAQPAAADGPRTPPETRTVPGFSYAENGRKLTVNFWGGVCSTYALEVREHPRTVAVRVIDTPTDPDRACILIAKEMTLTATLDEPLGTRRVVDATTGEALPRQ
ncbi:hypothetical protein ACWCQL_22935 [Streptomyces sp. NPDC002073]